MDEAEQLAKDRRLYHLHAATFIVGFGGLIGTVSLSKMMLPGVGIWLVVGFAAILSISGVLAIIVGRTLFSKRADDTRGFDFEGHPGDALETPGVWSTNYAPFANAYMPWLVLVIGLIALAGSLFWALS